MKILKTLEVLGILILILVVIAWFSTPAFFEGSQSIIIISMIMISLIIVGLINSIFRMFGIKNYVFMTLLGIFLILLSSFVFYFYNDFFVFGKMMNMSYWHKVSFISLPAICFEGGNITLFNIFIEKNSKFRTIRERNIMSIAFALYVVFAITTNFLFIDGKVGIESYALVYKVISFFVILITIYLIYLKNNKSHTLKIK